MSALLPLLSWLVVRHSTPSCKQNYAKQSAIKIFYKHYHCNTVNYDFFLLYIAIVWTDLKLWFRKHQSSVVDAVVKNRFSWCHSNRVRWKTDACILWCVLLLTVKQIFTYWKTEHSKIRINILLLVINQNFWSTIGSKFI